MLILGPFPTTIPVMIERRTVLITGASAGIGAAFASVFAEQQFNLVLTARRERRLQATARQLRETYGVRVEVLPADLSEPAAPEGIKRETDARGLTIDALVNNAGFGLRGNFRDRSWQEHARFVQVMMTSVLELCHLYEPGMVERRYGRIINVASLAGLVPASAKHTLYAPAKAFLVRFSEALALEHVNDGIHVTAICPGFVHTEFHDVLGNRAQVSRLPNYMWMDPQRVARQGFDAVMGGAVLHVPGTVNRTIAAVLRHMPPGFARHLMKAHWQRIRSA